jgi:hypothetical protein
VKAIPVAAVHSDAVPDANLIPDCPDVRRIMWSWIKRSRAELIPAGPRSGAPIPAGPRRPRHPKLILALDPSPLPRLGRSDPDALLAAHSTLESLPELGKGAVVSHDPRQYEWMHHGHMPTGIAPQP